MAQDKKENEAGKLSRRDIIAGLAALPIVGLVGYGLLRNKSEAAKRNSSLLIDIKPEIQTGIPPLIEGKTLRIGIIGSGGRGGYLMKALGFVNPDRIDEYTEKGKTDKYWLQYLEDFRAQENLNVKITAICDVFDKNANRAIAAGANVHRNGKGSAMGDAPKRFTTYKELIASPGVDAVIIATPDHWHVPIAIEAARNGKHVYCEKPLSWSVAETYEIRDIVKKSGVVFQLGHQGRQTESYNVARSLIKQDVIGKISLIEVCTNRNDPNGAWVYDIAPEANEQTIDWKQFIGQAPWHDFSLERFFRWRCWWDYST
ncbi:MAG: Gfo/Idh/MocA family protein, partial [Bacteroidales bacterium]